MRRLALAALLGACTPALPPTTLSATRAPAAAAPSRLVARGPASPPNVPAAPTEPLVPLDADVAAAVPQTAPLELYPLTGGGLFATQTHRYAILRDDADPLVWHDLPRLSEDRYPDSIITIGGTWPNAVFASFIYQRLDEEEQHTRVFRWRGGRWRELPAPRDAYVSAFLGLHDGGVLAEHSTPGYDGPGPILKIQARSRHLRDPPFRAGMATMPFASSPTGAVFIVDGDDHGYTVTRWDPRARSFTIDPLDVPRDAGLGIVELLVVDDREAYILGGGARGFAPTDVGYLARFDGAAWTVETVRTDRRYTALARTADGALWLTTVCDGDWGGACTGSWTTGRLLRRTAPDQWQQIQLRVPPGSITCAPILPHYAMQGPPTFVDPKLRDVGVHAVAATGATVWVLARPADPVEDPGDMSVLLRIRP